MRLASILLAALPLAVAGCGSESPDAGSTPPDKATVTTPPSTNARLFTATATVLEDESHGPQLCLGGVMESLPPQCGGPDITNWDWSKVTNKETASGATWGDYTVVGTYDGTSFTLSEPPSEPKPVVGEAPDFSTPCEPPEGGWRPVDPAKTTAEAQEAAAAYVSAQPDNAGLWVDQSINAGFDPDDSSPENEGAANDPARLVLNARFTGNLEHHESELRKLWGGALCVSPAKHSEAELLDIMNELTTDSNVLGSGIDVTTNALYVDVKVDDGLQEELDERYGNGVVRVFAALRPVE